MKKIICITVSVVMALLLLTACAGKKTESRTLDFDGEKVKITVDLSGGWEAEWSDYNCYLYPGKNDGSIEEAGWCVYMPAGEFDERFAEITGSYAEEYKNVQTLDDGSLKCESASEEYPTAYYYKKISDNTYLQIVSRSVPGDEVFNRIDAKLA